MTQPMFARISRSAAVAAAGALALVSLTPAHAKDPNPKPTAAATQQAPALNMNREICVKSETTGSRLKRMVCKTRGEWIEQEGFDPSQK